MTDEQIQQLNDKSLSIILSAAEDLVSAIDSDCSDAAIIPAIDILIGQVWDEINRRDDL